MVSWSKTEIWRLRQAQWLTLIVPFWIAIDVLISFGPQLQQTVFALSGSTAPSIYDSAFGVGVAKFPDLGGWLLWSLNPLFVVISFIVAVWSSRRHTSKTFSISAGTTTAILLTLTDIYFGISENEWDIRYYFTNIIANSLAGILIFLICQFLFLVRLKIISQFEHNKIGVIFSFLVISLIISFFCFQIITFMFQPTLINVSARIREPNTGFFISNPKQRFSKYGYEKTSGPFSIIPPSSTVNNFNFLYGREGVKAVLKKNDLPISHTAKIALLSNCYNLEGEEEKTKNIDTFIIDQSNVRSLGVNSIATNGISIDSYSISSISLIHKSPAIYWLKGKTDKKGLSKQTVFMGDNDVIDISDPKIGIGLSTLLIDENRDNLLEASKFRISVNQTQFDVIFKPGRLIKSKNVSKCQEFSGKVTREGNTFTVNLADNVLSASLWIEISNTVDEKGQFSLEAPTLRLSELSGWASMSRVAEVDASPASLGEAGTFSFDERNSEIWIDGKKMDKALSGTVTATGFLRGEMNADGTITISGISDAFWRRDFVRMNPTRWERLPTELQVIFLSLLGFILLAGIRASYKYRMLFLEDHVIN
ncbi:MAG: hypothetical protein ABI668_04170 [Sphingorhabdus sp.]